MKKAPGAATAGFPGWLVNHTSYGIARFILEKFYIPGMLANSRPGNPGTAGRKVPGRAVLSRVKSAAKHNMAECLPCADSGKLAAAYISHFLDKIADDLVYIDLAGEKIDALISSQVTVTGRENLSQALDAGRGIVLAGAHMGSVIRGIRTVLKIVALALPAGHKRAFAICSEPVLIGIRGVADQLAFINRSYGAGFRFIDTSTGSGQVIRDLVDTLNASGIVTANMEVVTGGNSSLSYRLFDKTAVRLPAVTGACYCAFRSRAAVLPWLLVKDSRGKSLFTFEKPFLPSGDGYAHNGAAVADYKHLARELAAVLGKWIAAYPAQWMYWDRIGHLLVEQDEAL